MTITSTQLRLTNGWRDGLVEWREGNVTCISVVFSWRLQEAIDRFIELTARGDIVKIGGPAADYAGISSKDYVPMVSPLSIHNKNATKTSDGCVFNCSFCIVPKIEGKLRMRGHWAQRSIIVDNNVTACPYYHFDKVVESVKNLSKIDFNQGVSAKLLTQRHIDRFRDLDLKYLRMAWDYAAYETEFMRAWEMLRAARFPKSKVAVYVLIGHDDDPDDALHRLEIVRSLGAQPFPMRYQPLDTKVKNSHVGSSWTNHELVRYVRYWSNLRIVRGVPFSEFEYVTTKEDRIRLGVSR
jgi:hypothetical protein